MTVLSIFEKAIPFLIFIATVAFVFACVKHSWFHRHPTNLFVAGLLIATAASGMSQLVLMFFPEADKSLSYLWFGVVLGPVAAAFFFEGCKRRAELTIGAENRIQANKNLELEASIDMATKEVAQATAALNRELEKLTNPFDAAAGSMFEDAKIDVNEALKKLNSAVGALQAHKTAERAKLRI